MEIIEQRAKHPFDAHKKTVDPRMFTRLKSTVEVMPCNRHPQHFSAKWMPE